MTSTEIDVDLLISLVQERPELWDRTLNIYKDRNKTTNSWRNVCVMLNPQFEQFSDNERKDYEKVRCHSETTSNIEKIGEEEERPEIIMETIDNPPAPTSTENTTPIRAQPEASRTPSAQNEAVQNITYKGKSRKRKLDEFELKIMNLVETPEPEPDRHLLFFKGILPTLAKFNDFQTVDFQMGVLQLLKSIQRQNIPCTIYQPAANLPDPSYTSNQFYRTFGNYGQPSRPTQCIGQPNPSTQHTLLNSSSSQPARPPTQPTQVITSSQTSQHAELIPLISESSRQTHYTESSDETNMYSPFSDVTI
ncbi:hypothetical protein FQR65_LT16100 [Abscondita terminalis]|nr:hypothetical protein FQR65_LT16100 [Abscondita terminalis]